jgi:hypothetical protein
LDSRNFFPEQSTSRLDRVRRLSPAGWVSWTCYIIISIALMMEPLCSRRTRRW